MVAQRLDVVVGVMVRRDPDRVAGADRDVRSCYPAMQLLDLPAVVLQALDCSDHQSVVAGLGRLVQDAKRAQCAENGPRKTVTSSALSSSTCAGGAFMRPRSPHANVVLWTLDRGCCRGFSTQSGTSSACCPAVSAPVLAKSLPFLPCQTRLTLGRV